MTDIRRRSARALRWSGGGRLVTQLVSWASTLVVIRLLEPADYGLMAMAMSVLLVASFVNEIGLAASLVRAPTLGEREVRAVIGTTWVVNALIFALVVATAPLVSAFYREDVTLILWAAALNLPIRAFGRVQEALLVRELELRTPAIIEMRAALVSTAVTLALALLGAGVWALVAGSLAAGVTRAVSLVLALPGRWRPSLELGLALPHLRFGGMLVAQRVLGLAYKEIDVVVLGRLHSAEALGLYATARQLANMPNAKIGAIVNPIVFATFARLQDNRERLRRALLTSMGYVALVTFPMFALASVLAEDLRIVVLGPRWAGFELPFQILCLTIPVRMLGSQVGEALNGMGLARTHLGNILIYCGVAIPAVLIGAGHGPVGVATGLALAYPTAFTVTLLRSSRHTGVTLTAVARTVAAPILGAVALYGVVTLVRAEAAIAALDAWLRLGLLGSIGGLTGLAVVALLDRRKVLDLAAFLRS
jgi:O-antigen/teichoic acid export membrane protein